MTTILHTDTIPANVRATVIDAKEEPGQHGGLMPMYLVDVDGIHRWMYEITIEAAANQGDTGDGLVPFYAALLLVCREFSRRQANRRAWGPADEADYETGELPNWKYGVTSEHTPFFARILP